MGFWGFFCRSPYSCTDDGLSRLAKCDDQTVFFLLFRRILQSKGIEPSAVFGAQTTLGSPTDYGAKVLTGAFENNSHAMHLEVAYALFKSCNASSCLKLDSTTPLPPSWLKENGFGSILPLPRDTLPLFTMAGIDLHAVRSLSSGVALAAPQSPLPFRLEIFFSAARSLINYSLVGAVATLHKA